MQIIRKLSLIMTQAASDAGSSDNTGAASGITSFSLFDQAPEEVIRILLISALIVIVTIAILVVSKKLFRKFQKRHPELPADRLTAIRVMYSVIRFIIILFTILIVLSLCGINISGAIAGLGIASAVAALAVQDLFKDFIMGMTIVTEKFFVLNDVVEYNGFTGKVIGLTMRTTKIQSLYTADVITISNRNISDIKVISPKFYLNLPLPYEMSVKEVRALFEEIETTISELPDIESCRYLGTNEFSASSVLYLFEYVCDPALCLPVKRMVNEAVQLVLEENHISIPYTQIDIHQK